MIKILNFNNVFEEILTLSLKDSKHLVILLEKSLKINLLSIKTDKVSLVKEETKSSNMEISDKKSFDIFLDELPDSSKRMKTVVIVREITQLDMKLAKEMVEKAPILIKTGLNKEEIDKFRKRFEDIGIKILIK